MSDSDRLMEKMDDLTKAIVDLKMEMVSLKYRIAALESEDVKRIWLLVVLSVNAAIMLAVLIVLIYRF